ncbi:MAG TPA: enolase C-terminal domain-like protein [Bryobacteraceae bacterium]|nr:enolase C-terminal domain-like protein [Bryobacteraceae bacterium]
MNRRNLFKLLSAGAALNLATRQSEAQPARGVPTPVIKDVQVISTEPAGVRLSVVKIITDQPGLYGYGCATFTQRAELVDVAVERYLKPFLIGKPADRIEDIWQSCYDSSYWRNGPVLDNAISGVDQALWDIKGRQAGLPVYQLAGGKCREAAAAYAHASGNTVERCLDQARSFMEQGFHHVRVQMGVPGMASYGASGGGQAAQGLHAGAVFDPAAQWRVSVKLIEEARKQLGEEVELLHDMHERYTPNQAVQFAKAVESCRLFFLEDPLSPEDIAYFRQIRQQCATPIAMGELFNSPHEWTPLIAERLIDYIRIHVSQAGGFTPCRKIAAMAEIFGVRTAWHGPGDVSPVGHMANVTLDVVCYNFGVQEYSAFNDRLQEVFHGCPVLKGGYLFPNEAPGWGIEVDEKAAAKYPFGFGERGERGTLNGGWGEIRKPDGTVIKQ